VGDIVTRITNRADISLPLAVWLVTDNYDFINDANYISVTTLMKPLRQIILPSRVPVEKREFDIEELIASRLGTSIHDSIEHAWRNNHERALKALGYPDNVIERVKINPSPEDVRASNEIIPVYIEQRGFREIDGYRIGGKFDIVADGIVQDFKSTSVWTVVKGNRDAEYALQMSLYRWIDAARPVRRITEDYGIINHIFTDWSKMQAKNPDYPKRRVQSKIIPLLSLEETEQWIRSRIALIKKYQNVPEQNIPECTDEDLWRSEPQFKYFTDPIKAMTPGARCTRNFSTLADANYHKAEKGGKGVIITVPGEPKRCGYCPAFEACTQKDKYL
jgi:hypothetical protein